MSHTLSGIAATRNGLKCNDYSPLYSDADETSGVEMRLIIGGAGPARVDQTLLKTIARAHR